MYADMSTIRQSAIRITALLREQHGKIFLMTGYARSAA